MQLLQAGQAGQLRRNGPRQMVLIQVQGGHPADAIGGHPVPVADGLAAQPVALVTPVPAPRGVVQGVRHHPVRHPHRGCRRRRVVLKGQVLRMRHHGKQSVEGLSVGETQRQLELQGHHDGFPSTQVAQPAGVTLRVSQLTARRRCAAGG